MVVVLFWIIVRYPINMNSQEKATLNMYILDTAFPMHWLKEITKCGNQWFCGTLPSETKNKGEDTEREGEKERKHHNVCM